MNATGYGLQVVFGSVGDAFDDATHLEPSLLTPILETAPFWQTTFLE